MSPTCLEGVTKWSDELVIISARYGLPAPPTFLLVSTIDVGLIFPDRFFGGSCEFFSLVSLCPRGSRILGGTAPLWQVMYREVFSLTSCFVFML